MGINWKEENERFCDGDNFTFQTFFDKNELGKVRSCDFLHIIMNDNEGESTVLKKIVSSVG
jgi:hypothetical protein